MWIVAFSTLSIKIMLKMAVKNIRSLAAQFDWNKQAIIWQNAKEHDLTPLT